MMGIEYEARMLDVRVSDLISILEQKGARKIGCFHQKRFVYDFIPAQKGRWIRLRSNGMETTLTIKEIKSLQIDGTKELEIVVSDFDDTNAILSKLGYSPRTYQENFRIEYNLNGVNFDIDKWPMIPPYVEIEGNSEKDVLNAIESIGLKKTDFTTLDVDTIYSKRYGIELDKISILKFDAQEENFIKTFSKKVSR